MHPGAAYNGRRLLLPGTSHVPRFGTFWRAQWKVVIRENGVRDIVTRRRGRLTAAGDAAVKEPLPGASTLR